MAAPACLAAVNMEPASHRARASTHRCRGTGKGWQRLSLCLPRNHPYGARRASLVTPGAQPTCTTHARTGALPGIADRTGQLLRNSLQDKLTPRGVPARALYRLDVSLTENRSDLVILKDSTSTFSKVRFIANFTLINLANGQPVKTGQTESTTTFNRVESDFAVLEAEKDARRRAADEISSDIRLRLGLYFNRIRGN